MNKPFSFFPGIALLLSSAMLHAQGYQALHGSAFTGSTAVFNNPASSVTSAYKWDLTLFSVQAKISTNALYIKSGSGISMQEDINSKFVHANFDVSLLNFLYKPDNDHAFNFGIRARSYTHSKTMPFLYTDSINSIHSFLITNAAAPYIQGFITHTGWIEADLNYSQVLMENDHSKLSGGVTLQIMKGISAAFAKINKVSYLEAKNGTDTSFTFTNGSGSYGYSAGYEANNLKDFNNNTLSALGLSMGIEYMTYNSEANAGAINNNINYDWKIGVSLMDLGANSFKPGKSSSQFYQPDPSIADADIDKKINNTSSLQEFTDSISTLFSNSSKIVNNFTITNPTRLIINVDKNLGNHFYVNGEMSLNFYSTSSYTKLRTRELNLLTVTPRWETIGLGVYLPLQYNTQGQLWVGAAVKLGPLVVGFHNFGILKKDALLNGGGYVLLSIHPFNKKNIMGKLDCPQ